MAKPRIDPDEKYKKLTVTVPPDVYRALVDEAEQQERSMSYVVTKHLKNPSIEPTLTHGENNSTVSSYGDNTRSFYPGDVKRISIPIPLNLKICIEEEAAKNGISVAKFLHDFICNTLPGPLPEVHLPLNVPDMSWCEGVI